MIVLTVSFGYYCFDKRSSKRKTKAIHPKEFVTFFSSSCLQLKFIENQEKRVDLATIRPGSQF